MPEKMIVTRGEIQENIREYLVKEQDVDPEKIKPEALFVTNLGFDSLSSVELVIDLEDKFGISIPDEDAKKIQTVGQAIEYIFSVVNPEK